jgi:uncharacterized protein YciI
MYFAILCFDKPGTGELRETTRPAHLAYLKNYQAENGLRKAKTWQRE